MRRRRSPRRKELQPVVLFKEPLPRARPFRDATASLENWSELFEELLADNASVALVADFDNNTNSLDDKSEKRPFRATWMEMYVRGGTRWRVDLRRSNSVASVADRQKLMFSIIAEVNEVVCWRAKDVLFSLGFEEVIKSRGLCDPQLALWMLDPDTGHVPLVQALAVYRADCTEDEGDQLHLLWKAVKGTLTSSGLLDIFQTQEMQLVPLLAHLEKSGGYQIDTDLLQRYTHEACRKMDALQKEAVALLGGSRTINLGSVQQMTTIVFDELGLGGSRKKVSSDARPLLIKEILEELQSEHALAPMILLHRKLQKLREKWLELLHVPRVRSEWLQTSTYTGKLVSAHPDIQNLPRSPFVFSLNGQEVRISVRDLFTSRPGYLLLVCDFAQLDVQILALLSNDAKLQEFCGSDVYGKVCAYWKRKKIDLVTLDERETARCFLCAWIGSGMRTKKLTATFKCSNECILSFFDLFPQLCNWMEHCVTNALNAHYVMTLTGRKMWLRGAEKAQNLAVSSVVQGIAADLMKQTVLALHKRILDSAGLDVTIASFMHDGIVCEVRDSQAEQARAMVEEVMQQTSLRLLAVSLATSCKTGFSMGQI